MPSSVVKPLRSTISTAPSLRAAIYEVAREACSHDRRDSYTLTVVDFR
ncbi:MULTISPECIES: hypothetical protein [Mesorhizobium]|nr:MULTISPECIES: hypothetical protein [Mesorhizobium]